jgi:hypothetical protein
MDPSEARNFNSRRRRNDAKRRRVETAAERLVRRHGLPSNLAQTLSEGIYRFYGILKVLKSFDDQDRYYRQWKHLVRDLAKKTANAPDTELSAYVADMREFAAHMTRLETLERRNISALAERKAQGTGISRSCPSPRQHSTAGTGGRVPEVGRRANRAVNRTPRFLQQRRAWIEGTEQREASQRGIRRDGGRRGDGRLSDY